jgi:hypothetical protein
MELECLRADDIWENSTIIQDIDLIFCSRIALDLRKETKRYV